MTFSIAVVVEGDIDMFEINGIPNSCLLQYTSNLIVDHIDGEKIHTRKAFKKGNQQA